MPMEAFTHSVASLAEGKLLLDVLARYDAFQFENNVKPDYCNAGGLHVFDETDETDSEDGSWVDWYSVDGEEIDFYDLEALRSNPPQWQDE